MVRMTRLKLRDYQIEAIQAVEETYGTDCTRPAIVLPTGAGKTVVFAAMAERYLGRPDTDLGVLVIAHRDELVQQAVDKIGMMAPGLDVGVVKAERDEHDRAIVVASVQTLASSTRRGRLEGFGLGIVDECHHATARTYRTVMDEADAHWVGVTATMARGDRARLGDVWQKIVYQRDIPWMIRRGHLADVAGIAVKVADLELAGVSTRGGDYAEGALGEALVTSMAPTVTAQAYAKHGRADDGTSLPAILFAPTVEAAHVFADAMTEEGFRAATVYGAMPLDERRATLADFEAGKIDVLCNCMVLTEGFDSPRATVAIIARPTTSAPLYVQMVGRVLRTYPGKRKAMVLDVVGAASKYVLATLATLSGSRPVEPKPGQTLLEALDEDEKAAREELGELYAGPVAAEEIDLFHGSRQAWLKTEAGFWFIPAGERFIALTPNYDGRGGYDVAWYGHSFGRAKGGGWIAQGVDDIGYAMAFGEADLKDGEDTYAEKRRGWRTRKASEKQAAWALRMGLPVTESTRAGELSDMISIALASKRIDGPMLKRIKP
jgi:superfamily II DNA or RNA helicase